jgi:hypothetical protein
MRYLGGVYKEFSIFLGISEISGSIPELQKFKKKKFRSFEHKM